MQNIFFTSSGSFLNYIEAHARRARLARQQARLRRELARLPRYVADDIGAGPNQDRFINILDD
jgi:hypothetical protein